MEGTATAPVATLAEVQQRASDLMAVLADLFGGPEEVHLALYGVPPQLVRDLGIITDRYGAARLELGNDGPWTWRTVNLHTRRLP